MPTHASENPPANSDAARGVLALELTPGHAPREAALKQSQAAELAHLLGRDLTALVEGVRGLDLVFAAAHFDPAEVLRPGWPLHRRLEELQQRAPRSAGEARVIAFGTDNAGKVPLPLQSEAGLHGGSLRVLPFLLTGDAAATTDVAERMEQVLLDRGMAQADTALLAQEAFGARIEHARYLTVHDLAAMTALQYRNQGLDALWQVIETALLRPGATTEVDQPPEPLLRYADGEARIALFPLSAWKRRHIPDQTADEGKAERLYELYEARQRQYASILQAHGIEVTFAYCEDPTDL